MGRIPEHIIESIRERLSIAEVVGAHVQLKRAGRSLKGLCPFHTEKTPSFTVNEERGTFKCFGCGKGGNAFTFLMEMEGRSFPEAAELLAKRAGIELPRVEESESEKEHRREREIHIEILDLAKRYYRHQFTEGRAGEEAREYARARGIEEETAETFSLGCAPKGWDNLARFLTSKGYDLAIAERAGVLLPRKNGGYYDRFRDRLIFPIADSMGRTVSFGGRVMGDDTPKYLNGPETEVFHKGRVLYGLLQGTEALRKSGRALMVEGYMDVVILHQRGVSGCLATLGTALTREHVEAIRRRADEAVLIYDGDNAGRKAMERSLEIFLSEGFPCRAVALPDGEDPDSFVGAGGDLNTLVDQAPPLFELTVEMIAARNDMKSVGGRLRAVDEVLPFLRSVGDELGKNEYMKRGAELLGVDENLLRKKVAEKKQTRFGSAEEAGEPVVQQMDFDRQQLELVRRLIHEPDKRSRFIAEGAQKWIDDDVLRGAATFIASCTESAKSFPIESAPENIRDFLAGLLMEDTPGDYDKVVGMLEKRRHAKMSVDMVRRIKLAEERDDTEELLRLLAEKKRIDGELKGA